MPSPTPPQDATAAAIEAERAHLNHARTSLRRMREYTESLKPVAGDAVSAEYLKRDLHRRLLSLADHPDVPLFFGRIDYAAALGADQDETCYIGRRHVIDAPGNPLVIDWRAPLAEPFYRASPAEPMGVARRRRFGFRGGDLTAFEDEDLCGDRTGFSELLEAEIERPRTGPMRDIVATIQPEQDEIVRAELSTSICVQGAPGTGKTAVGLHRAAYLLFTHRDQLSRSGVLVVGPNESFLGYIGDVLPALGELEVAQRTVDSLLARAHQVSTGGIEPAEIAVLKGDDRLAAVIQRAVWGRIGTPGQALVVPRGSRQFRIPAHVVERQIAELRERGVRYEAGRTMLAQRLAHEVLLRMEAAGDSPDDRVQAAVARSRPVRAYCDAIWPKLDGPRLVRSLLTDPKTLALAAAGILTEAEQALLLAGSRGARVRNRAWTSADLALLDEAADALARTHSLGHVILDEAQDLSAMQLRAVGRRASTGSMTILGDLAQATTPWATTRWAEALAHLGQPDALINELTAGFRVPGGVIDYAARLLPTIAPGLAAPYSVRRSPGDLQFRAGGTPALQSAAAEAAALEGTIGVIVPDALARDAAAALLAAGLEAPMLDEASARSQVVPASLAKGLEFDHVVLLEPAEIVAAEPDRRTGLRRLYVCLTRAVTSLRIVADTPLPHELGSPSPTWLR